MRRSSSQRAARLQARVHAGLEEAEGAAAVGLGAIERHVGVLQELVGVGAVGRRQRDADAGADHDLVAVELERLAESFDDRARRARRPRAAGAARDLQDRELVAAEARDDVGRRARSRAGGRRPP